MATKYSNIGKIFFKDIYADNSYDAYIIFYQKSKEWDNKSRKYISVMKKTWFCKTSEVETYLNNIDINPKMDYYFTINSFKNPKGKDTIPTNRKSNLFAFNGIVIDIDCHYQDRLIEKDFSDVMKLIEQYTFKHHLPMYNYIIKTGRGLHIYYLFKPCSSKLNFLVEMANEYLIEHYKKIVEPMPQFLVDAGASKRYSGIYRMPYTFNQATKTQAEIKYWNTLRKSDINDFLDKVLAATENTSKKTFVLPALSKAADTINDPNPPNIKRCTKVITEVEKYQSDIIAKATGHENRNRTCLVYSAFLLNVYSQEDALKRLKEFNSKYKNPLPERRLITILNYLLENHTNQNKLSLRYFTNAKILELLEIESGEYNIIVTDDYRYNSFTYNVNDEEQKARKKEKASKRKKALSLLEKGLTYNEISQKTSLSIATISRLNKQRNSSKLKVKDIRPWEKEGISRATYYRNLKKK